MTTAALQRPWLVLAGLALGVTVTNGFARFAYGLLLPAMKSVDIRTPQGRLRFDPAKRYPYLDYYFVKVVAKGGKPAYQILDVARNVRPD